MKIARIFQLQLYFSYVLLSKELWVAFIYVIYKFGVLVEPCIETSLDCDISKVDGLYVRMPTPLEKSRGQYQASITNPLSNP